VIRSARPGDEAVIHQLICELAEYERSLDQVESSVADLRAALFGPSPALYAHVAEHEGAVAGFALWFVSYSTWTGRHGIYLEDLYVRPGLRGHGLGAALLAELAAICVQRGYPRLEWAVLDWNEPALGFYRRLGAEPRTDWVPHRVSGPALARLAQRCGAAGPSPSAAGKEPPA
jgi:GNAT superfamily N-acetyltransferase